MQLVPNPQAIRAAYPAELKTIMSIAEARRTRAWLAPWKHLAPEATPLWSLPKLAAQLGLGAVWVKDESKRSALGSFKALGAPAALSRLVLREHPAWDASGVLRGDYRAKLNGLVVISATDGNHGRALAAAAQSAGVRCVIVLHQHVSAEREHAIAAFGAEIVRIEGNYDDSVSHAAQLAEANGWRVVSDTSYPGYEEIPRDVMQGYGALVDELAEQGTEPFSHVLLQGGVGGMAAGVASYLWEQWGAQRPIFIVVEPQQADCLLQSALNGVASKATGSVDSVMAGLACGETSPLAWRFLAPTVDFFLTIEDQQAVDAMRLLAHGAMGDVPIVSGESGAAGLAGVLALALDQAFRARVGLGPEARVLVVNTEGATAPSVYQQLAGRSAEEVLLAQQRWQTT
ncbi:diaminopropionate ammonia-lyase [Variovorax sp. HJSM1_2]|uniref:diaminopropionate ammonia-lyase n=1 Tax=Variovorax sp. HJSM1_2 TaxID=3366263 RepID=UPI003BDA65D4